LSEHIGRATFVEWLSLLIAGIRLAADEKPGKSARPPFEEKHPEDAIRTFAFNVRKRFLTERAKFPAICSRCQRRLEYWSRLVENFDRAIPLEEGRTDA
jgi:hypothetical protein